MSKVFRHVTEQLGTAQIKSSTYHPQSQGVLERFLTTLKNMLRTYYSDNQKKWDQGIPFVMFAAWESIQESLGFSLFELVFGHPINGPLRLIKEKWISNDSIVSSPCEYVEKMRKRLADVHKLARSHLRNSQEKMKIERL